MDGQESVSVVIPAYNRANFLEKLTLPSVVSQTLHPVECIVVDDGSKDNTAEVVKKFANEHKDFPITYVYQDNGGRAAARNAGIVRAKGEWILALDSDDAILPDALKVLVGEGIRTKADIVRGRTWHVVWGSGKILGIGDSAPSSVLLRKKVFTDYGLYDENRDMSEDLDHHYRMNIIARGGGLKVVSIAYPTSLYFRHPDQETNFTVNPARLVTQKEAMLEKWEDAMPKDAWGKEIIARMWRNKGVYQILSGDRDASLNSIKHSLSLRWSIGTEVVYLFAILGAKPFSFVVPRLKRLSEKLNLKLRLLKFSVANPNKATELIRLAKRMSNS